MKTSVDQKYFHILNKASAILDKLKQHIQSYPEKHSHGYTAWNKHFNWQ